MRLAFIGMGIWKLDRVRTFHDTVRANPPVQFLSNSSIAYGHPPVVGILAERPARTHGELIYSCHPKETYSRGLQVPVIYYRVEDKSVSS